MTSLRLLADDLTGALDTAAAFVPLTGIVPGFWHGVLPDTLPPNAAIDCATRELDRAAAMARHHSLASTLQDGDIAFKKIDSLLRGHGLAEIAACLAAGAWTHAMLAPAFPFQGRVTRHGRQYRRGADGGWQKAGPDLVAALRQEGVAATLGHAGEPLSPGVTVMDAQTDADLHALVHTGLATERRILWCGSAGLAQALVGVLAGGATAPSPGLDAPILGLFGSDQDVTARQLDRCVPLVWRIGDGSARTADRVAARLASDHAVMLGFDLPPATGRADAAVAIRARLAALLPRLARPAALIVAGGETLRTVCDVLGAARLDVTGALQPGVPRATMRGGIWDGVDIVSKSGAFGDRDWLRCVLRGAGIDFERTAT